jgi:hypothetical protein
VLGVLRGLGKEKVITWNDKGEVAGELSPSLSLSLQLFLSIARHLS